MNAFATLSLIYFLFTLISSSMLCISFRKKLDDSVIYFLISELCMVITCAFIFMVNMQLVQANPISIGVPNFGALVAELAILFCILSITKRMDRRWFIFSVLILGGITAYLEWIRSLSEPKIAILMNVIILTILFVANYLYCKNKLLPLLTANGFITLFGWFEFGLVGYGFLRLFASFSGSPIIPRDTPQNLAIIAYAIYIVLSTFRYMSYIGFRMTWVDPNNPSENFLNKPLVKAIEEKNRLLQGLTASNRVIGISALASSLAHQLSQPLTTIAIRAETTRRDLLDSGQNMHSIASLDEISTQSGKLADLIHNLRQLFSTKNDNFEVLNLQKVTNQILEIIDHTLESKKITLRTNYQSDPLVLGDSIQLQQVLINILNNAIDAISQNKNAIREISISINEIGNEAVLTIADTGSGIKPEILPKIFELYNTTKDDGLGVGLWLSKTIIERHQGSVKASNQFDGGAKFEIVLPLRSTEKKKYEEI